MFKTYEECTFDTFVVTENNENAYTQSKLLASGKENDNSPFFIEADKGLGKTHLLRAIKNELDAQGKSKTKFSTCQNLIESFHEGVNENPKLTLESFSETYKGLDVFLIDDLHLLKDKPNNRSLMFKLFNLLTQYNIQLVITFNKPASHFSGIGEQLFHALSPNYAASISKPDYLDRLEIINYFYDRLRKRTSPVDRDQILKSALPNLASFPISNISKLEEAVIQLSNAARDYCTVNTDENYTPSYMDRELSPTTILEKVAIHFNISMDTLINPTSDSSIDYYKQIAYFMLSDFSSISINKRLKLLSLSDSYTARQLSDIFGDLIFDYETNKEITTIKRKILD